MRLTAPLLILLLMHSGSSLRAQDVHLSQFFETPLLLNPALAGIFSGDVRLQVVHRNQWQSVGYPYQTTVLSGEYKFNVGQADDYMTVGLSAFYDKAGIQNLKTIQVMPTLNYHKLIDAANVGYLSAGFMAGFVQRQFDGTKLSFDNQYTNGSYDPFAPTGENFTGLSRNLADFAVGLVYSAEIFEKGNWYLGTSLWHFNKPKVNFLQENIQLNPKWQANAGINIPLSEIWSVKGEMNYLKQGLFTETMAGVLFTVSPVMQSSPNGDEQTLKVSAGMMMRVNDALVPVLQLGYNQFKVGVSYDVNTSSLKTASQGRGGFELTLSYQAFTSNQSSSLNSVRCPRF
jgi:type IX secretion system PorP/SprF family membrane protein